MLKISEKRPFFRADMAGLGIYHMGGYGRIGVYRVVATHCQTVPAFTSCYTHIGFLVRS